MVLPVIMALLMAGLAGGVLLGTLSVIQGGVGALGGTSAPLTVATSGPLPSGTSTGSTRPPTGGATPSNQPDGASSDPGSSPQASPPPTPAATPTLDPPPGPGPFSMDLYRKGAFVSELKPIWCVPAAMQTSINIMRRGHPDVSRKTQVSLYRLARAHSTAKLQGAGAEPEGWAEGLNQLGYGPYVVDVEPRRAAAIHKAALQLRLTGRPVGLLTWRGAHSWVMSGFTASADPAYTRDFTVTGIYVEDVWYPRISTIWGASLPPDSLDPIAKLPEDYLRWHRPTAAYPDKDGQFVMVLPVVKGPPEG
jgi:hypothetical protein